jgi:hypothetical protein
MARKSERGAVLVEYPLILLLIGLFVSVSIELFSNTVVDSYLVARVQLAEAGGTMTTNPAGCGTSCGPNEETPPEQGPGGLGAEPPE